MKHLVLALALAIAGCATSIPPESVDLSQLVGDMVTSAKVSHVNLVNLHFDHLSNEVDRFALGEYKDAYLSNVRKLMKERNPDFVELSFSDYDSAMSLGHRQLTSRPGVAVSSPAAPSAPNTARRARPGFARSPEECDP